MSERFMNPESAQRRPTTYVIYGIHPGETGETPNIWAEEVNTQMQTLRPETIIVDGLTPGMLHTPYSLAERIPVSNIFSISNSDKARIIAAEPKGIITPDSDLEEELQVQFKQLQLTLNYDDRAAQLAEIERQVSNAHTLDTLAKTGVILGVLKCIDKIKKRNQVTDTEDDTQHSTVPMMSRRQFLKKAGIATAATASAVALGSGGTKIAKELMHMSGSHEMNALAKAITTVTNPYFLEIPNLDIRNAMYGLANEDDMDKTRNPNGSNRCIVVGSSHHYGIDPSSEREKLMSELEQYVTVLAYNLKEFAAQNPTLGITDADIYDILVDKLGHYDVIELKQFHESTEAPAIHDLFTRQSSLGTKDMEFIDKTSDAIVGTIKHTENSLTTGILLRASQSTRTTLLQQMKAQLQHQIKQATTL